MQVIKFTDLEKRSWKDQDLVKYKTFPNTPDGIEKLANFLLNRYYIPYRNRHNLKDSSFKTFFKINARNQGLKFLALDAKFFHFDICIAEIEPDSDSDVSKK